MASLVQAGIAQVGGVCDPGATSRHPALKDATVRSSEPRIQRREQEQIQQRARHEAAEDHEGHRAFEKVMPRSIKSALDCSAESGFVERNAGRQTSVAEKRLMVRSARYS